ncbi:MAG: dockerin type I repeat-containing protein [Oscillospiraceae bacterium]|nr:dockerin type I repeat-containing protein [Oscillospiraceae bacterium]
MKIISLILSAAIMFSAYQPTAVIAGTNNNDKTTELYELTPSKTGVDDFIAAYGETAQMKTDDSYNVSPGKMADKYGFNVFRSTDSGKSILLYNDNVYQLGEYFGGVGVTSFAVSDIDCDGFSELYFTYSWGSGMQRSQIGCFDTRNEKVTCFESFCYPNGEMILTDDDGVVSACAGDESSVLTPAEKIAEIVYDENGITFRKLSDKITEIVITETPFDINCDESFNAIDVMALQEWVPDVPFAEIKNIKAADVNADSNVNILDLCLIKNELVTQYSAD